MDTETTLSNLVQIGTVTALNEDKSKARVKFQNTGIISDWLAVLQRPAGGVSVAPDGAHTHGVTDTYTGGGSASTIPDHSHTGTTTTNWAPKINDTVLVIFLPTDDGIGDGAILGVV